jgi:hypothetical protein
MAKVWLRKASLAGADRAADHDSDYNLSRTDIYTREKRYSNSLTQNMVPGTNAGVTNYYLLVYPYDSSVTTPSLVLWSFDSRGG